MQSVGLASGTARGPVLHRESGTDALVGEGRRPKRQWLCRADVADAVEARPARVKILDETDAEPTPPAKGPRFGFVEPMPRAAASANAGFQRASVTAGTARCGQAGRSQTLQPAPIGVAAEGSCSARPLE